jgi:protein O-mannosyl-transferase
VSTSNAIEPQPSASWPITAVIVIALLAMFRAVGNDWSNYDDDLFLFRNPYYDPPTLASLGYYWTHGFRGLWTPVTHSAWWIVAKFSQIDAFEPGAIRLNPWTFHAFNVLLHCVASVLVYLLVRRVVRGTWAATAGAAVFAAHPVQVEAVAWACGTKDVLAVLFAFAAILFTTGRGGRWRTMLAIAFAALAMLSKPSAVVLPVMVAVYAWISGTGIPACNSVVGEIGLRPIQTGMPVPLSRWLIALAMCALAIPVAIIARQVQIAGDVPPVSLLARLVVAIDAITMHFYHLSVPVLAADYGLTPGQLLTSPRRWWTWLIPLALAFAVWRSRDRALIGGTALFVVALAPNLGLAPFQFQVYSTVADRYAYPAMLGIAIVIARLLTLAAGRFALGSAGRHVAAALGLLLVVGMCLRSFKQCATWADAGSLWSHTLSVNGSSPLAHNNLGASLIAAGNLRAAMAHFEIAAGQGSATDGFALLNLVQLHLRLGEAEAATDAAIRLVHTYRKRADFDADLERKTVDRFAAEIGRISPSATERLRVAVRR